MMFASLGRYNDWSKLLLRISVGATFIAHGMMKWPMLSSAEGPMTMKILAIAEPLGGAAILLGFLTPLAALGLMIIMLGAIHAKITGMDIGFTGPGMGWEFDFLLFCANAVLLTAGPGKVSVDGAMNKA